MPCDVCDDEKVVCLGFGSQADLYDCPRCIGIDPSKLTILTLESLHEMMKGADLALVRSQLLELMRSRVTTRPAERFRGSTAFKYEVTLQVDTKAFASDLHAEAWSKI